MVNRIFGSRPLVVHAHGPLVQKPAWPRIREAIFSHDRRRVGEIERFTLLTCNNGADGMGLLERSAEALGIPYMVRGQGISPWMNSRHKPAVIHQALLEIETEYVLYADSRDAVVVGDLRPALERFSRWNGCDLLFGGDRINWPALDHFRKFELSLPEARNTEFRYLNGGAWLGKTAFCREFFAAAVKTEPVPEVPDSEQGILKALFPRFYPKVQIDYRCEIFQNIGFVLADIFDITAVNAVERN